MQLDSEDDHDGNLAGDTGFYGVAPAIAGVLFGLALIWFMFALADGFA